VGLDVLGLGLDDLDVGPDDVDADGSAGSDSMTSTSMISPRSGAGLRLPFAMANAWSRYRAEARTCDGVLVAG